MKKGEILQRIIESNIDIIDTVISERKKGFIAVEIKTILESSKEMLDVDMESVFEILKKIIQGLYNEEVEIEEIEISSGATKYVFSAMGEEMLEMEVVKRLKTDSDEFNDIAKALKRALEEVIKD